MIERDNEAGDGEVSTPHTVGRSSHGSLREAWSWTPSVKAPLGSVREATPSGKAPLGSVREAGPTGKVEAVEII